MNIKLKSLLFAGLFISSVAYANAQVYVNVRPVAPRIIAARPAAPSPRHVWVGEHWVPQGHNYQWQGGYWAAPPRPRAIWVPGRWDTRRRGYVWVPGYWR